jgi:hypothetical protein
MGRLLRSCRWKNVFVQDMWMGLAVCLAGIEPHASCLEGMGSIRQRGLQFCNSSCLIEMRC